MAVKLRGKKTSDAALQRLAGDVSRFDEEFVIDSFGPMTAAQKKKWERAKRKRGRPKLGDGCKVVSVSIEKRLLKLTDDFAKRHKVSRAKIIRIGLKNLVLKRVVAKKRV